MASIESVVSNTSPLLNLALVDRLSLLETQFDRLVIPTGVREELLAGPRTAASLRAMLTSEFISVRNVTRDDLVRELRAELDQGESEAIALAIESDAECVLIDESDGRQVARRHDLAVTGVIGILIRAATEEKVDIEVALGELRDAGFWIDDSLYERAISTVRSN